MLELEGRPDTIQRTVFIETFANWHGDFGQLKRHIVGAEHPGLRSGICLVLVDALTRARPEAVPNAIQNLMPLREQAVSILRTRLDQSDIEPTQRLHAACALAGLDEFAFVFPFASIRDANLGECSNVIDALEDAPRTWLYVLNSEIDAADANQDWPFKARLAIVALHLGRKAPAEDMLEFERRPDPVQRTVFIETFANWHGDLGQLTQQIVGAEHPGLRSGICLAVGSMDGIDGQAKARWESLLTEWYSTQPDCGTHSAAGWALRQWNGAEPPIDHTKLRDKERGWTVTSKTGLTMIRIPAGRFEQEIGRGRDSKRQIVRMTQDFLLSDREITIELFREFANDEEYQVKNHEWEPGLDGHPVAAVDWYAAVMFCNWLSWKENLTPCYKPSNGLASGGMRSSEEDEFEIVESADGFRLPTEAEWEYACRAGTTTRFSFGDDETKLARYGVYRLNSTAQTARVGSRLCNAWGLFDMHGNVLEWCWDRCDDVSYEPNKEIAKGPYNSGSRRAFRGGSWDQAAGICESAFRIGNGAFARFTTLGFRVARSPSGQSKPVVENEIKLD